MLDRAAIAALIPHAGAMVLLDEVVSWDTSAIVCRTMSHTRPDNPLRYRDGLPAVCGAEYGAQAAAVHGPLLSGERRRPGHVVLLRDVSWTVPDLGRIAGPLTIRAECIHRDARNLAYRFEVAADATAIVSGECGIILG
jgi:predicted hotdog family 3-hydroxylacyl-ACP dehydratase